MEHRLIVVEHPGTLAKEAARFVTGRAHAAIEGHGIFHFAVSGGRTPWEMFAELTQAELALDRVALYQVDERVAPDGDPQRNLTHLRDALGSTPAETAEVVAMPVTAGDLDDAAISYAKRLPERFDLLHLGLGPDGHTASLVPGDPVLDVDDRLVAVTADAYQGQRRMTLTYPALRRATELVWLVAGADKRDALAALLDGDRSIPAGRVDADCSTVIADADAVGRRP